MPRIATSASRLARSVSISAPRKPISGGFVCTGRSLSAAGSAFPAAADQRHVPDVDLEAVAGTERCSDGGRTPSSDLPRLPAAGAVEVPVLVDGAHVELLAAVGAVAMPDEAQVFEHVERAVHRRRDGVRTACSAAVDE